MFSLLAGFDQGDTSIQEGFNFGPLCFKVAPEKSIG
jgi:hypothetical protein